MLSLETLKCLACEVGFDDCSVARARRLDDDARFMDQWVAQGLHGEMTYLERNGHLRYDPTQLVPHARTVVVCVLTYDHSGRDYHRTIKSKLYELEALLGTPPTEGQNKFCDSAPFLERRWAEISGMGFIGRNHQFIHHHLGSFVHLGELVLLDEMDHYPAPQHQSDPCANCQLCVDACPGHALGNDVWDARKCIAYTTHKCTICQQVCPLTSHPSPFTSHPSPLN